MGGVSLEYPATDAVLASRNARGGVEDYLVTLTGGSSCNYVFAVRTRPLCSGVKMIFSESFSIFPHADDDFGSSAGGVYSEIATEVSHLAILCR